jgi:predicted MFS family arabinose efflux permease
VGIVADSIGRRVTIILCGACFMLGGLLMAAANAYGLLLLGRLVIGVSIGAGGSVVAVYTTEIAPASSRSTIVAVNELSLCFGCLVCRRAVVCATARPNHLVFCCVVRR